jgi:geranylgeranyl diphosphate synthase type I
MAAPLAESFADRLDGLGGLVDAWTREAVARAVGTPAAAFGQILEYHLGWRSETLEPLAVPASPGKRVRAAITLLVCEAVCGSVEPARAAAVAVELVHNFSLVHDDIQDHSPVRRSRPTIWTLWGKAQGINAGDALFALAMAYLAENGTTRAAEMVSVLSRTCLRLVQGQYLDLDLQQGTTPLSTETYDAMVSGKTAALFEAAARLGAISGGASHEVEGHYAAFGHEVGIAFQEQDDLLGVWGDADQVGKAADDVAERKRGLPAALALTRPDAPTWLCGLYADSQAVLDANSVRRVVAHLDAAGIRTEVEQQVARHYGQAMEALALAGGREPAAAHLRALCDALVDRRS